MHEFLYTITVVIFIQIYSLGQTVTDIDGNVYNTVTIGTQTWMQENLRTLHYSDGSSISDTWIYDNDTMNFSVYGVLYTWNAAMNNSVVSESQGACPDGWHVPSDAEWTVLGNFLGGNSVAGGKMKVADTTYWWAPNTGADNSSGFSGMPGGEIEGSVFQFIGKYALFWSSTQSGTTKALYRYLAYNNEALTSMSWYKTLGYSVRCIKDSSTAVNKETGYNEKVLVFPNPAENTITVVLENVAGDDIKISITDISGQTIKQICLNGREANIDVSMLREGVYFVKTETTGEIYIEKIIKK